MEICKRHTQNLVREALCESSLEFIRHETTKELESSNIRQCLLILQDTTTIDQTNTDTRMIFISLLFYNNIETHLRLLQSVHGLLKLLHNVYFYNPIF